MEQININSEPIQETQESYATIIIVSVLLLGYIAWLVYEFQVVTPKEFDRKIKAFNNGSTLICHQMGSSTLVSKENGWSIHNDKYFLKDGTLLDIYNNCFMDDK